MTLPQSGLSADRELPAGLADQVERIIRDYADTHTAAVVILERISQYLDREGWRSPETASRAYGQIVDWSTRTGNLPEHHINRDVLISHLAELAQIMRDL